ncbi:MAG: hypothetical protein R3F17_15470 [Planctomycetota bacterium]
MPSELFHDPVFGSPHLLVRGYLSLPANSPTASHLEALDNPGQPLWFQVPASGPPARLDAVAQAQFPFGLPLNPYGVDAERFDFVLHFDQPILPSAENLAKLRIEHFSGAWIPLPTRALLESNCPDGQTVVRLRTEGMFRAEARCASPVQASGLSQGLLPPWTNRTCSKRTARGSSKASGPRRRLALG